MVESNFSPEAFREFYLKVLQEDTVPTRDVANSGPTESDFGAWLEDACAVLRGDGLSEGDSPYPNVMVTARAQYKRK
jgi:hypothetical protein